MTAIMNSDYYDDYITCYLCDELLENEEDIFDFSVRRVNNENHYINICKYCYDHNTLKTFEQEQQQQNQEVPRNDLSFLVASSYQHKQEGCEVCKKKEITKLYLYNVIVYHETNMFTEESTQSFFDKRFISVNDYIDLKERDSDVIGYTYIDTQELMICDSCSKYANKINKSNNFLIISDTMDTSLLEDVLKREKELFELNKKRKEKAYEVLQNCLNKDIAEYILQNNDIDIKG